MVEFSRNPFEGIPSQVSIPDIMPTGDKIPFWAWVLIIGVIAFIGYQIFVAVQEWRTPKDKN